MKKLLPFFLLLSFFLTPTFASASAVTRESKLVNQALNSASNTSFSNVSVSNNVVSGVVDQAVFDAGSGAVISQPVSFAADSAAVARSAAAAAGRMAAGVAIPVGVAWAVQKLLDGVGYVIDEGSKVIKKPADSQTWNDPTHQYYYTASYYYSAPGCGSSYTNFSTVSAAMSWGSSCLAAMKFSIVSSTSNSITYKTASNSNETLIIFQKSNPNYNSSSAPQYTVQTQQQTEDAFLNWMKNNPTNITDPIIQKMYTPAQTTGWNLTGEEGAHHGVDGITDEIAQNIIDHRNAELSKAKSYTLTDSAQLTQTQADGAAETVTKNPDGSTTRKTTRTVTDPTTGKQTTTTTTTTTQADGTTQTSTETTTADSAKTKIDIPAACEWFSVACDWFNWTKKDDAITDNPQIDQSDLPTPTLSENAVSWGSQCPNPQLINFNLMGQTANIQLSWTPVCTLLSYLYYPILAGAYIAAAYIVIGAYKS